MGGHRGRDVKLQREQARMVTCWMACDRCNEPIPDGASQCVCGGAAYVRSGRG